VYDRVVMSEADAAAQASVEARAAGDLNKALACASRCLELRQAELGELHADTAAAYGLVGAAQRRKGALAEALAADRRALEIFKSVVGDGHADTATAAGNLSATYRARGEHAQALELAEAALAGLTAACGAGDLRTAVAWGNLAAVRRARGEHQEAIECGRELVRIRAAVLGDMHSETADARSTLGALLAASGDHRGAAREEETVLAAREAAGDPRRTLDALANLATISRNLNDAAGSLEFQKRALQIQRTLLGEADPATSRSRLYVAYTLVRVGRRPEALRVIDEGLRHDPGHADLRQLKQQVEQVALPGFRTPGAAAPTGKAKPKGRPRGRR
jgi:tetratricopeptide (TPR) repeat protein